MAKKARVREIAEQITSLVAEHARLHTNKIPLVSVPFVDSNEEIDKKMSAIEWKICRLANELATLILEEDASNG